MDPRQQDEVLKNDLSENIKIATHSGQKTLDQTTLQKIKNVCRRSDKYVEHAYHMIMKDMEKKHSEIRFSAFQICDELFRKSHRFRTLVVDNLQLVFELVAETNPKKPLPLPGVRAQELKALFFKTLHIWHKLYGPKYKKLVIGYKYLKDCIKIDFSTYGVDDNAVSQRSNRQKIIYGERKKKIIIEINDMEPEIQASITTLRNCINLVFPEPEEFFIHDKEDIDGKTSSFSNTLAIEAMEDDECSAKRREVGIASAQHSVELYITPSEQVEIEESSENESILENAKETVKLINNRYLPLITSWIQTLSVISDKDLHITKLLDLKKELDIEIKKYNNLKIRSKDDEISTDSEMEEVDDEPALTDNKITVAQDNTVWNIQSENPKLKSDIKEQGDKDPQPSTSKEDLTDRKQKLLPIAPKLPFDVDLYHWEDEHLPTPTILPVNAEGSRFWSAPSEELSELPIPEGSSSLRTRVIEFTGKFEPISHTCRAPLSNGKLCPRKDKYKCPFHGEIFPRDEIGKCINLDDAEKYAKLVEKQQRECPDWQSPVLLREIKAKTGLDLKMPDKKRKGKRKKYPGLTDIKTTQNTAANRLSKKIFKRSTMKKIATRLDKMDYKRFRDKYGDHFHYTFDSA